MSKDNEIVKSEFKAGGFMPVYINGKKKHIKCIESNNKEGFTTVTISSSQVAIENQATEDITHEELSTTIPITHDNKDDFKV